MKKNIIITGASRGIGAELAKLLSVNHNVLLISRNNSKLEELKQENPAIQIEVMDIATSINNNQFTDRLKKFSSSIDILINNAGTIVNKPALEISRQEMEHVFSVNVFGLIEMCQAVIPSMKPGSHIVNIGSMGGFQGSVKFSGLSVYSASKAAVAGYSECLAEELKDSGISVNCLALGASQTEMLEEAFPGYEAPLSAKEMASFIADFSLNANRYLNGKVIPVSLSTP